MLPNTELRALVATLPHPCVVWLGDVVLFANDAFASAVGHAPAELLGLGRGDLLLPEVGGLLSLPMRGAMRVLSAPLVFEGLPCTVWHLVERVRDRPDALLERRERIVLAELLDEAIERSVASLDGVGVERSYESVPSITGNRPRLCQLFMNLLENAAQALPPALDGRSMQVSVRDEPPLVVEVRDCGSGICPEDLPGIFEPFYSTRVGRRGLGLTVSRAVVEEHGGRLLVDSAPDRGTVFRVELPRRTPMRPRPQPGLRGSEVR